MAEEKQEEKKEIKKEETKIEAPQAQSSAPAQPDTQAKPQEAKPQEATATKAKKEGPANCAGCNKSIRKKRWYHRNGKFYCTKRCWKTAAEKEAKPEAAKPEQK